MLCLKFCYDRAFQSEKLDMLKIIQITMISILILAILKFS